ncbi:MAG TPA: hypothetical protein PKV43_03540 [Armatimonadota bacterium]|nr:hypothetical protein [Armatimonadota bacterium]
MLDNLGEPLSEEETEKLVNDVAAEIIKRRLETPAVLFLEMHKPLSFIASQGLIVALPFLAPILGQDRMSKLSRFLQGRDNVERLIQRIEDMSEERDTAQKEDKQK